MPLLSAVMEEGVETHALPWKLTQVPLTYHEEGLKTRFGVLHSIYFELSVMSSSEKNGPEEGSITKNRSTEVANQTLRIPQSRLA